MKKKRSKKGADSDGEGESDSKCVAGSFDHVLLTKTYVFMVIFFGGLSQNLAPLLWIYAFRSKKKKGRRLQRNNDSDDAAEDEVGVVFPLTLSFFSFLFTFFFFPSLFLSFQTQDFFASRDTTTKV